jgi:hypothetical protein
VCKLYAGRFWGLSALTSYLAKIYGQKCAGGDYWLCAGVYIKCPLVNSYFFYPPPQLTLKGVFSFGTGLGYSISENNMNPDFKQQ